MCRLLLSLQFPFLQAADTLTSLKSMAQQAVESAGLTNQVPETETSQATIAPPTLDRGVIRK